MSTKVKIVTDSSAYPKPEVIAKHDIRVVPLRVAFGSEVFAEGVDITNEEFYQKLAQGGELPTTSQPSVADFIGVYRELAEQGHPILSIHISSKLSGTCASALAAKNALPQAQIEIVDALNIAMGMLISPAAEAAEKEETLSQIVASIEKLNKCIKVIGAFDTLEYLWKGGRIGAARALVGTLLKIKPVSDPGGWRGQGLKQGKNQGPRHRVYVRICAERSEREHRPAWLGCTQPCARGGPRIRERAS